MFFMEGKIISTLRGLQTFLVEGSEVALFPVAIGG